MTGSALDLAHQTGLITTVSLVRSGTGRKLKNRANYVLFCGPAPRWDNHLKPTLAPQLISFTEWLSLRQKGQAERRIATRSFPGRRINPRKASPNPFETSHFRRNHWTYVENR
jgi:hypothetical protein